jgi:predicted nucleotidyltransferase
MRDELQKLQKQVSQFIEKGDYVKSLGQWGLLQQSIKELTGDGLSCHIQQGHQLATHFLTIQKPDEADKIYQQLKTSCFELTTFTASQKVEFCQTVATAYANNNLLDKALENAVYGLWLSEHDNLPQYQASLKKQLTALAAELQYFWSKNLWANEINQLKQSQNLIDDLKLFLSRLSPWIKTCLSTGARNSLQEFYQQLSSLVNQFLESAASRLHVTKQKSLADFSNVVEQLLPLAELLVEQQQWEHALAIYQLIIKHAEREAAGFDKTVFINKITKLNGYLLDPETVPQIDARSDWQQWRETLRQLRNRFQQQLTRSNDIVSLQAKFSQELKELLVQILKTIEVGLGVSPCPFSFLVLGSLAREDASPYSDVDFVVLVADENHRHADYFQALIHLFAVAINLVGEPNGLAVDSGDLGYLTGKDKICLNTPANLAKRFSPAKHQDILDQPETHALHRPVLLYASAGGESLLTEYQTHLQTEWSKYRSQWVSGYVRLHYEAWQVLSKKACIKSVNAIIDLKEDYLRPLLLWLSDIALQAGIELVNIPDLLREFAAKQVLDSDFLKELTAALETIQKLRIELQLRSHSQEEKLDILKNMSAGLALERIRSQVLVPAYESLLQYEKQPRKQLKLLDPVIEYLLQAIDQPSTAGASVASTSSSSSSTSSNAVSFFKPAPPLIVEQAIQTFVEVMLVRGGKPIEQRNKHREIFSKLSTKLRIFYLRQLVSTIAEVVKVKKIDSAVANYVLQALYMYPDVNGLRKSSEQQMTGWETTLLNLTELPSQNSQSIAVTLEWFNCRGQKEKRLLKQYYVEQLWGSQGKLGGHDKSSDGRRLVRPLQDPSGELVAYVKVYPELPGIQLSVNSLVGHVSGEGMKSTVVRATTTTGKSTTTYPLLLSEPVPGKTLQQVLREQGHLNDVENNLDPKSFTLKVFESLLINPEDDKADNLVAEPVTDLEGNTRYRIVSVDSDHAYVEPLIQAGTLINRQEKVQVKSILYCMEAMLQALDPEAIQEFLLLDPFQTLNDWLSGLHVYNQRYVGNRELNQAGLFTETEIQNYAEGKDFCFVQTFFEPGWVVGMYEKFLRLQAALRENPPTNHLELLTLIEPRLAVYYEQVFAKHKTARQRFQALPTEYVTVAEKQTNTVRYQSTLKTREKVLKSITILDQKKKKDLKSALKEGGIFTPDKAQKAELEMIHTRYQQLHDIRTKILQGSVDVFVQLEYGDFFKEKVINSLDFSKLDEALSKSLLQGLPNISFFSLSLSGCRYLTDELLKSILKGSPNLRELDVSDCTQLTDASFYGFAKYCKHLVKLIMANTGLAVIEPGLTRSVQFNSLKKLRLPNCEKLVVLTIDAPELEELQLRKCAKLTKLNFKASPPKFLDTSDCIQLEAQQAKAELAAEQSKVKLKAQLAKARAELDSDDIEKLMDELVDAAGQNNLNKVRNILQKHPYSVDEKGRDFQGGGLTALQTAADKGHVEIMKFLIGINADIDLPDKYGVTSLMLATRASHVEAMRLLIDAGADVNADDNRRRPVVYFCGNNEGLILLLKAGVKSDTSLSYEAGTIFSQAASNGDFEKMKIILAYHDNTNLGIITTTLKTATENNHPNIVSLLNEYLANPVEVQEKLKREVDGSFTTLVARR